MSGKIPSTSSQPPDPDRFHGTEPTLTGIFRSGNTPVQIVVFFLLVQAAVYTALVTSGPPVTYALGLYWSIVTLSTGTKLDMSVLSLTLVAVGYGDVTPVGVVSTSIWLFVAFIGAIPANVW